MDILNSGVNGKYASQCASGRLLICPRERRRHANINAEELESNGVTIHLTHAIPRDSEEDGGLNENAIMNVGSIFGVSTRV